MTAAPSDARTGAAPRPGMPKIARGGVLNLLGAAVTALTGVLLTIVVTRTFAKSDAGVFFTLTSLFLLAEMVARLGTGTGLVYFIARLRSLGQPERIRAIQRAAWTPVVVLSVVTAVVLVVGSGWFAELSGNDSASTRLAVIVLAVLLPITTMSDTLLSASRGYSTMLPTVALDRIGRPVLQLGLVAAAVLTGSMTLLVGAWAVPWALSALLAWWWLRRLSRGLPAGGEGATRATYREFWGFTWARAVNSLVALALQRLDIVLITVLIGPAQAAIYTAATRFLVVGQQTALAISTAAQPRLAEVLAVDDRASAKAVYQSATAWIVLLNWPLYLLCAVFAEAILSIFGSGYAAGRPVVLVLAGAMLIATACGMVDMLLNMAGRTSWTLANSVVSLVVMVVVDLLLIPRLGILGAGIGWAAAIVANNALPLIQLRVAFGLHPFGAATLRAAALCAGCFLALPLVTALLMPDRAAAPLVAAVLGTAVYVLVCARWRAALGLPALRALRPRVRRLPAPAPLEQAPSGGIQ